MQGQALSDLRVVELGRYIAAPYCSKLLADLGAEVVKVEDPQGDPARYAGPFPGDKPHAERSALFLYLNTNKKSITLDVRAPGGARILQQLLRDTDVLVEDNAPGEAASLGLDFRSLHRSNPRLIVTSITPFGQTGPYRDFKATDLIANHMSGLAFSTTSRITDASQEPLQAGGKQGDFTAGLTGAVGTMLALFSRDLSGEGQHVDISIQESLAAFVRWEVGFYTHDFDGLYKQLWAKRASGSGKGATGLFPCKDGYVSMGTREQYQWEAFVDMLGNQQLREDPRFSSILLRILNWPMIEPLVLDWMSKHTKEEIFRESQARRVPAFPCNTTGEVYESAQIKAREYFVEVEHPELGLVTCPGAPYKLSRTPWRVRQTAPRLGEHNQEILCGWLGYGKEDVLRLGETGLGKCD